MTPVRAAATLPRCRRPPGGIAPPSGSARRWPPPSGWWTRRCATDTASGVAPPTGCRPGPPPRRDPARPLAWFHAASVGEGLQAESVLLELRRLVPRCQLVYTHFSPSAEPLARRLAVDAADYLPYDLPGAADRLLGALAPDLLVFSKLDLWPELATRAAARRRHRGARGGHGECREAAGSAGPRERCSRRATRPSRRPGPVAEADAERLARLGVPPDRIRVLGDPRFDSVAARVAAVPPDEPLLRFGRGAPTLVAGSTWPPDEAVLLDAFARVRAHRPEARLILVPHEPTAEHLAARRPPGRAGRAAARPRGSARAEGPVAAAGGGPRRRARHALRGGDHGVRRRRVRAGGAALGARAGGLGRAGGIRAPLARTAGTRSCCCGQAPRRRWPVVPGDGAGAVLAERWERWIGGRTAPSGAGRAARARSCRRGWARRGGRRRCWRSLFRHDPLEGDRARDDEARRQHREQHVAPAAPHPDLHVGDAVPADRAARPAPSGSRAP